MNGRGRVALVALTTLLVFLLATLLRESDRRREADARRDVAIARLEQTNDGIVSKLSEVFAGVLAAEAAAKEAGTVPAQTVARIAESLKGFVDPTLIEKALAAARGRPGPAGPPGPPGPAAAGATTTSTVPAATTSSTTGTSSSTTTTIGRPTTTTTQPCTVGALGLCLIRGGNR